jgi:pimeloyl-ACP methyl ester carboxylesterase
MMRPVLSRDGTPLAVFVSGSGPPLVVVHGTSADHTRWAPILGALEARFTVHAMDRRGRGQSGDHASYALEREFEDVAAVIDSIGGPVSLLGHSYGAICSLEAAVRTPAVKELVLYEPPIPTRGPIVAPELVLELEALFEQGQREAVVSTFFRKVVRMPPAELELLKQSPSWPARLAAAGTIPREERGTNDYRFEPSRFTALAPRTRLLLGGDSPAFFSDAISLLKSTLPSAEVVVMPGQQHVAINTAPELFTRSVLEFLSR